MNPGAAIASVHRAATKGSSWQAIWEWVAEIVPPASVERFLCYRYEESAHACVLDWCELAPQSAPPQPDPLVWEGRYFGEQGELRWWRPSRGSFAACLVSDVPLDSSRSSATSASFEVTECSRVEREYYLVGRDPERADGDHLVLTEGRYGTKAFRYPIRKPATEAIPRHARVYISVREYRRLAPKWSEYTTEAERNRALNEPLLFAHRFVAVKLDKGPCEEEP